MEYNIETVLGDQYLMFFHPGLSVDQFSPVQTLDKCVSTVNWLINQHGRNFLSWDPSQYDVVGQLMRANWIYNRLMIESIRKPILVHHENHKFIVDCGDTRIMAVSALPTLSTLSAVITTKAQNSDLYKNWIPIQNNQDLINACGFDHANTIILITPNSQNQDWCISWLEIGDGSTSHHLHDVDLRITMLQKWFNNQPSNFCFSTDWIREPIDWSQYQSND